MSKKVNWPFKKRDMKAVKQIMVKHSSNGKKKLNAFFESYDLDENNKKVNPKLPPWSLEVMDYLKSRYSANKAFFLNQMIHMELGSLPKDHVVVTSEEQEKKKISINKPPSEVKSKNVIDSLHLFEVRKKEDFKC